METISTTLLKHDSTLTIALFVILLAVLGVAETARRRRKLTRSRFSRWYENLGRGALS